jgi:hypothetical protein
MPRLPLHKPRDVAGAQAREREGTVTEAILEKTADERHVIVNRCFRETAYLAQVLLVCLRLLLRRR